jgi:hypothetical protein
MTDLPSASAPVDRRAATALVIAATALSLLEYLAMPWKLLAGGVGRAWFPGMPDLGAGVAWVAATTLLLVVVSRRRRARGVRRSFGERRLDAARVRAPRTDLCGTSARYDAVRAVGLPRRVVSRDVSVRRVRSQDLGAFIRWEVAYLFQFLAIESFFRGYPPLLLRAGDGAARDLRRRRSLHHDSLPQAAPRMSRAPRPVSSSEPSR